MVKLYNQTSSYGGWTIIDASRSDFGSGNPETLSASDTHVLYANDNKIEGQRAGSTGGSTTSIKIYDNGFQFVANNDETNADSTSYGYIYMAFA